MDGNQQRDTMLLTAEKIRLMRNGNVVILVSLAVVIFNALLALYGALTNPLGFFLRGGTEMVAVFLLLGTIAIIIGGIMYLVGLYGLRKVRTEYRMAFLWEVVSLILSAATLAAKKTTSLGTILDILRMVVFLVILWLVIQGTKHLIGPEHQEGILSRGTFVWGINLVSTVLGIVYSLIPTDNQKILALAMGALLSILIFAAAIYYVLYLGKVAVVLGEMGAAAGEGDIL